MYFSYRFHYCMTHGVPSGSMLYLLKQNLMMMLCFTACSAFHSSPVLNTESVLWPSSQETYILHKSYTTEGAKNTRRHVRNRQVCATCSCCHQCWGRMQFPHRNLLPSCKKRSKAIKKWINPHKYHLQCCADCQKRSIK